MSPQTRNAPDLDFQPAGLQRRLASLDYDGYWRREPLQVLRLTTVFALLYAAMIAFTFALDLSGNYVVAFWPAAGLLAGVLGCTPGRTWPLWLAGAVAGRYLAEAFFLGASHLPISLSFSAASCAEALLFASLIANPLEQSYRLQRPLFLIIAVSVVALFAAMAGGFAGAGIMEVVGGLGSFWEKSWVWIAGDYLGIIVIAPMVAWLLLPQIRVPRPRANIGEYAMYILVIVIAIAVVPAVTPNPDYPYGGVTGSLIAAAMVVPVAWAAIRFDFLVSGCTLLLFTTLVVWGSSNGIGPFGLARVDTLATVASVQIYLIVTVQAMLFVAFGVIEREGATRELEMRRSLQKLLVSLSNKLLRVNTDDIDQVIESALKDVAHYAGADRAVLFQIDADGLRFSLTHSWFAPGVVQGFEKLSEGSLTDFSWAQKQLAQRGYFTIKDLRNHLPSGFDGLLRQFPASVSGVYLGLFAESKLFGCIGFLWLRQKRRSPHEALPLLHLVGQLFGNVVRRLTAEKKLDNYQIKLRSMAREISLSEERARRRAAVDLHDSIGQNLAVAKIITGKLLSANEYDEAALRELQGLLSTALRGTRYIISDLSPAILYELGLVPALKSLAERFEPTNNVLCSVTETGSPWELDDDLRVELYRAVRELMTNIAKHAGAQSARIHVAWAADDVQLTIEDDGVGFEAVKAGPGGTDFSGFGLFNVREGIQSLGGFVNIESSRGIGTKVSFSVPHRHAGTHS